MRSVAVTVAALLGSVALAFGAGWGTAAAGAQDEGAAEGIETTLNHDGEPVVGVTISVYTEDGALVGSAETDADGYWMVPVPRSATYRVELDASTLPDGLVATNGTVREPFVRPGDVGGLLFGVGTGTAPPPGTSGDPTTPADGDRDEVPDDPEEEVEVASGAGLWDRLVSHIYDGVHLGLIIALAAVGLSLVFGTTGLINFSQGELVTFGAFAALLVNVAGVGLLGFDLELHLLVAVPAAVALGALFGYLQDRLFWGWLRRRGTGVVAMMIISIGVALVLRHLYLYQFGGGRNHYQQYVFQTPRELGPLTVQDKTLVTDAIALVVLVAVGVALLTTRLGKAIRAVADNRALAAASGINVDQVTRLVWAAGTGLAALAGVFLAIHESANYQMGFNMLLLIFAAVIVGGLGTAFGAIAGGVTVGVLIQVSTLWVPSEFKYVVAMGLLIVVLVVRPQGLLGRRVRVG